MKILELKPIKETPSDYDKIEEIIKKVFFEVIYLPLLKELSIPKHKIKNSKDDLIDAMNQGKITFSRGAFRGEFNASISKELRELGAKWDRKTSSFKITLKELPYDLRGAIQASRVHFESKMEKVDKRLAQILPAQLAGRINIADIFDKILWKVDREFHKNVQNITLAPQLTAEMRAKIADEWQNNMDLWIKDFTEKEIVDLRKSIQESIFAGNRYESLIKGIQKSYGVTANKSKFLARQETNLLLAKFKETRYTQSGIYEYKWRCVHNPKDKTPQQHTRGNVRYSHGILDGKIFRFDNPPVTTAPGEPERRNNPGQDYNCRCVAIPIVKFQEEKNGSKYKPS